MRIKQQFKTIKNSQRLRVTSNGVHTITAVKDIIDRAVLEAVKDMDQYRVKGEQCLGITKTYFNKPIQVDLL